MNAVTASPIHALEKTLIRVGCLVGGVVLLAQATTGNPVALAAGMGLFTAVLAWIVWAGRSSNTAPPKGKNLYAFGIAGTMALYVVAITLINQQLVSWGTVILIAMVVMTPALLAAHAISRLAD